MRVIDRSAQIFEAYENGIFDLEKWKRYADRYVPGARELCLKDVEDCIKDAGLSWEKDYLPVLNELAEDPSKAEKAVRAFRAVTEHLEERILKRFKRSVDADVILYLGLCNGAGWVTALEGKTTVLLGIEKIAELNWCDINSMNGLIIHELGHAYQSQYGTLTLETGSVPDRFLWQLFTEGVAMVFEQEVIGDPEYFHQDVHGWKNWCDRHAEKIRDSFDRDLKTMTPADQRYFGDWVSFEGYGDTGYYLGTRFVRFLMRSDDFDDIIRYDIARVRQGYDRFLQAAL